MTPFKDHKYIESHIDRSSWQKETFYYCLNCKLSLKKIESTNNNFKLYFMVQLDYRGWFNINSFPQHNLSCAEVIIKGIIE